MALINPELSWMLTPDTEPVDVYRKTAQGEYDGPHAFPHAKRMATEGSEAGGTDRNLIARLPDGDTVWHVWASGGAAGVFPKPGDFLRARDGRQWVINVRQIHSWGARLRLTCSPWKGLQPLPSGVGNRE